MKLSFGVNGCVYHGIVIMELISFGDNGYVYHGIMYIMEFRSWIGKKRNKNQGC